MNRILPIGSVVMLEGATKPVMIFGYLQQSSIYPGKIVDYVGVPYPEGNLDITMQYGFMMDDIAEIIFEGYRSKDFEPWAKLLEIKALGESE
ncbi:MAG: DUF4176 domain-containing protein [Erysipelotrichaceae bacterium]|nr:DUF4176 domain-containing protein [Erysipelotrichaceae bacterium]